MPERAARTEPVSRGARRHLRRGVDPAAPPTRREPPAPTPAPAPSPPPPVVLLWGQLGKGFKGVTDRLYIAAGVEPPPLNAWEGFAETWGAVADYYLPRFQNTPLPKAVMATLIIAAPLLEAYQKKQAAQAAKPAPAAPEPVAA